MSKFWLREGGWVAAQVNGARWLEWFVPAASGLSLAAGCMLLVARRAHWSLWPIAWACLLMGGCIAGFAFQRMRRNWFTREDGLARLDSVLGLHNRLTSAAAGVGEWPSPVPGIRAGFHWRWHRLAIPASLAIGFLLAAFWLPLSPESMPVPMQIEPPVAWSQVEAAVEEMKRNEAADADALSAVEQRLEALRQQSPESWYSQSSLEAGAALQEETSRAISSLERNLNAARQSLASAGQSHEARSLAESGVWNEALKGLQAGSLPLNKTDAALLKQCCNGKNSLSPEQSQALQKKLSQQGVMCQTALAKLGDALANATCDEKLGCPQDQPGQEGGGGGTAPLGMRPIPTALQPEQMQALESKDLEHAAIGDVIDVTKGTHKVDPDAVPGMTAGGSVSSGGDGGEAVWKITPSPKEEAVLKRYFK